MYEIDRFDVGPGAYGIAFGPTGVVCVTLVEAGAVARIDPDGAVERVPLPRDGARPMVLAPGLDDDLFFSSGDGWIGRIDGAGTVTAVPVPLPGAPYGVCVTGDGALWCTVPTHDQIVRVGPDGADEVIDAPIGSMPSHITVGPDGWPCCTLHPANALGVVAPDGLRQIGLPTPDAGPVGIAATADTVWFTEINAGRIGRWAGDRVDEFDLGEPACRPHAVAASGDGGCWTTLWAAGAVVRLDADGRIMDRIALPAGSEPHGLAVGADGSLWVALETVGAAARITSAMSWTAGEPS